MRLTALANEFGSDKGTKSGDWGIAHRYTEIYERFLRTRANEPLRILEIGVWKGSSLRMWEEYLPNASIVGVDILAESTSIETKRAEVVTGDASDAAFLRKLVDERFGGSVDLVIDDGSHVLEHQIVALESLFPRLNDHGLYCVEDISVSRFASNGLRKLPFYDFLDYAWALSELATFFADFHSDSYHTIADVRFLTSANLSVPAAGFWNLNLFGVYFFHNMCVFERHRRALPESVRESEDVTTLRPTQGNAHAYRKLFKPPEGETSSQPAVARDYVRSIAVAQQSLQERLIDIAVGRRLIEADGSVPEALGKLFADYEQMFSTFNSQMADIRADADRLLKQYCDEQAVLTRVLGKLNLREAEFERLRASLEQRNLKQHTMEVELTSNLGQNDALRAELATAQAQNEALRSELATGGTENDALRAELAKAQTQNDALRGELATGGTENDALRAELATAQAQNDTLRSELATGGTENDALRAELATARAQNDALCSELATGGTENDALRAELAKAQIQNDALRGELATGGTENDALRVELATAQAQNDALRAELATGRAQNDWLRAELGRRKTQMRALKKSVSWQITWPLRIVKKGILWFQPRELKAGRP
jgi:hypothetical protein